MVAIRTDVVKNLDEGFLYAVRSNDASIVAARSIGQMFAATGATTIGTPLTSAARGAGYLGSGGAAAAVTAYAVALTAINDATVVTVDGQTATFAQGDPPGTAIPFSAAADIQAAPSITSGVAGDQFAIVEIPPTYSGNLIQYVNSKSNEPAEIRRDIRDHGNLMHRKLNALKMGTLTFTNLYENQKAGLMAFVDQDFIVAFEREDDRGGTTTEIEIYYGCRINTSPPLNESTGDTDTDNSIVVNYEFMAIVGESL